MLGLRDLNRTLLRRQHLLGRADLSTTQMVEHLVGLQAQDPLPPYLSLAARIEGFDPQDLSRLLETGALVRMLTLRATIHVLTREDALTLRAWVQPVVGRGNQMSQPAGHVPVEALVAETRRLLADGPLPVKDLGERLHTRFPDAPAAALAHVAREQLPLAQLPPRGLWKRSGGVVYQAVDGQAAPDVPELVRRYLRAFGPATAADLTTWSRVTRLGPVLASMTDLVTVECEDGRRRYDVPDAPYASGDEPAPVRLLGTYDNVWLSHADRSRIAQEDARARWMGPNGGAANVVFVDGFLAGLWRAREGRVVLDELPPLTRTQRSELDEEVVRVEALLAR